MATGMEAYRTEKFRDAEKRFKQALKLAEAISPEGFQVASTLTYLGMTSRALREPIKAEPLFKRALVLLEKNQGPSHPDLAFVLNQLGLIYYERIPGTRYGRSPVAVVTTQTMVVAIPGVNIGAPALTAQQVASDIEVELNRATRRAIEENFAPAEVCFQRVLAIDARNHGADSPQLVPTLALLGDLYYATRHYPESETTLHRALAIVAKHVGADSADAASLMVRLANSARRQKNHAEAEKLYSRALAIQVQTLGPEHPDLIPTLESFGALLKELDRKDEAKQLEQRASVIRKLSSKR